MPDPRKKDAKGGIDKSKGSPYDLDPNSPHNMSNQESAEWFDELKRRQREGLPLDKPPGYYDNHA